MPYAASPLARDDLSRVQPAVRRITTAEVWESLRRGWNDFLATPTQLVFLALIYPIVGLLAAAAFAGGDVMDLLWPLVAGLSLVGPVAALGIYEISRRRERGEDGSVRHAFDALRAPGIGSIAVLGVMLLAIFVAWVASAHAIYGAIMGGVAASSPGDLLTQVFTTPEGLRLLLIGNGVGFLFALLVLSLTAVSFPLLLERDVGPSEAVRTSLRAVATNPVPMALWGLIVAVLLLGSIPAFVGLAVVMPVLGHGTWHLYRKVVEA